MIDIRNIIDRNCTRVGVDTHSRKRLLEYASDLLAETYDLPARSLFDELMSRERLGSTGLGEGVAIPHCRIPCDRIHGAFLRLAHPVDFESIDGEPVDLIFILLVPPDENSAHLEVLAQLARLFGSSENRLNLRIPETDEALFDLFIGLLANQAA